MMARLKKTRSRACDGYVTKFRIDRKLEAHEISARLDAKKSPGVKARDRGLLRFNSVFVEYVEQQFFTRGWAAMGTIPMCGVVLYFGWVFANAAGEPLANGHMPTQGMAVLAWVSAGIFAAMFCWMVGFGLTKDFFCYTHYPIRFNRKNRKVYVFKRNGEGGVFEFNWDDGYWFVGDMEDDSYYDLRCHVLDAEGVIRHTFSIGAPSDTKTEVLQHWELIRRYMEEPLTTLPFPPLRLFMVTAPTWRNSFIIQAGSMGGISKFLVLSLPWTFFRVISQKTCRPPIWPDSVEAACQIPADDPYRMPEPTVAGEPVVRDPASVQREKEYNDLVIAEVLALEGNKRWFN